MISEDNSLETDLPIDLVISAARYKTIKVTLRRIYFCITATVMFKSNLSVQNRDKGTGIEINAQ